MNISLQRFLFVQILLCVYGSVSFALRSETAKILLKSGHSDPRPPVILIPGMISSRLVSWKQKKCYNSIIEIQDIVWLNLKNMVETITFDKHCWLDCLKLENNGSDPFDCKLRPDEGLGAIAELSPGSVFASTSIYTPLIQLMSKVKEVPIQDSIPLIITCTSLGTWLRCEQYHRHAIRLASGSFTDGIPRLVLHHSQV